jgi:hypothetical protein
VTNQYPRKSTQSDNNFLVQAVSTHASPLAPLNDRDLRELVVLFDRKDSDEIEADVISKLNMLYPEPSWDEEPYDFLQEYL